MLCAFSAPQPPTCLSYTVLQLTLLQPGWSPTSHLRAFAPAGPSARNPRLFHSTSSLSLKAFPDHPVLRSHPIGLPSYQYFLPSTNTNLKLEIYLALKKKSIDIVIYFQRSQLYPPPPPCHVNSVRAEMSVLFTVESSHPDLGLVCSKQPADLWE